LSWIAWFQLLTVVLFGTVAQLALKATVDVNRQIKGNGRYGLLQQIFRSPLIWIWFVAYAFSTLLWLWALRSIPLSQAFPILGLQFALIPIASNRFLHERLSVMQWCGVFIIVIGVALVGSCQG